MEKQLIETCKTQIQQRYFAQKINLTQRDFFYLIELIEERSGILVSLSTLKRIWKGKYVRLPQVQTLNALVSILDYDNWNEYKLAQQKSTLELSQNSEKSRIKLPLIFTILALTLIAFVSIYFLFTRTESISDTTFYIPESLSFSADKTVTSGVPNTVIFSYDLSEAKADSFSIQRSWNPAHRTLIDPTNTHFTEIYYYPGFHKAKLMANDSIIREEEILIQSEEWLATFSTMDNPIPAYLPLDKKGTLSIKPESYEKAGLDLRQDYYLSYYFIQPFNGIFHDHYELETRLKIENFAQKVCPFVQMRIIDETDVSFVTLVEKGCEGNANIKIDDTFLSGRDHDLSSFGLDLSKWQQLRVVVKEEAADIFINAGKVLSSAAQTERGRIVGFIVICNAPCAMDYIRLKDSSTGMMFSDEFDQ
ncbi:MAG: hypothetical protein AAF849_24865 [Bacteroidota bacterium]